MLPFFFFFSNHRRCTKIKKSTGIKNRETIVVAAAIVVGVALAWKFRIQRSEDGDPTIEIPIIELFEKEYEAVIERLKSEQAKLQNEEK